MFETIFCTVSWIIILILATVSCLEGLFLKNWQTAGICAAIAGSIFFGNVVIAEIILGNYLLAASAAAFFLLSCFSARLFASNGSPQDAAAGNAHV